LASSMKDEINAFSLVKWGRIFLIAISFSKPLTPVIFARYNSAIPPVAILSRSMYFPNWMGLNAVIGLFATKSIWVETLKDKKRFRF